MITYIGMDFEASGTNPWGMHVPIQLGFALSHDREAESLIGGWNWNEWEWQEEAFGVHGITKDRLLGAPRVADADILLAASLLNMGVKSKERMWNVPVGWGVAGYDQQFITRWFPCLRRLLSRRSVDLNALTYSLAGESEREYGNIKKRVKRETAESLMSEDWHDALYDAKAALVSYDILKRMMRTEA